MPRTPPPPGQVTLSNAVAYLHKHGLQVSKGMIYKYLQAGRLKQYGPESHKQKFYSIEELNRILSEEVPELKKEEKAPVIIDWLKASDMPACLMLDQIVYNLEEVDLGEASTYQSWRRRNQNISVAAFDARDRNICLGYVGLVPVVSEQICLDILSGRRIDHSITVEEIDRYDHAGPYTLLAISACTHPDRPDLLYPMLYKHIEFWKSMYPQRYIKKIFAQSVSESGDRLAQMLFMAPRPDLNINAYEIDMQRPQMSRLLRKFKQELADIAPLPRDLQWRPLEEIALTPVPTISIVKEVTTPRPAPVKQKREEKATTGTAPPTDHQSMSLYTSPDELPEGSLHIQDFMRQHGIDKGRRRKLTNYLGEPGNNLGSERFPKPKRPDETDWFLTPDQQQIFLTWLQQRHPEVFE